MYGMERFVVEEKVLRENPEDAIRILRLGALGNAITSTIGLFVGSLSSATGRERDLLQATLILVSYFKEVVDQIDHPRPWELIRRAADAGLQLPRPVDELRHTFSRGKTSFYKKRAVAIRHKKGFHVDPDHFKEWLAQLQAPFVTLWRRERAVPYEHTFTASAQVQSLFGQHLNADDLQIMKDIVLVPLLVEAMAAGLLLEHGIDPRQAYVELLHQYIRIEYSFNDGRPSQSERIRMLFDADGFLEGVLPQLRAHVTRRFGGRLVGAILRGTEPVELHSPFGTARAWADGSADSNEARDQDRELNLRFLRLAETGKKTTERSLEFAELLRKMRAPVPDIDKVLDGLRAEHTWWDSQLRSAEASQRRHQTEAPPKPGGSDSTGE
jgi:hypothetical protein